MSRGFGFVHMSDEQSAAAAKEASVHGRRGLVVHLRGMPVSPSGCTGPQSNTASMLSLPCSLILKQLHIAVNVQGVNGKMVDGRPLTVRIRTEAPPSGMRRGASDQLCSYESGIELRSALDTCRDLCCRPG